MPPPPSAFFPSSPSPFPKGYYTTFSYQEVVVSIFLPLSGSYNVLKKKKKKESRISKALHLLVEMDCIYFVNVDN